MLNHISCSLALRHLSYALEINRIYFERADKGEQLINIGESGISITVISLRNQDKTALILKGNHISIKNKVVVSSNDYSEIYDFVRDFVIRMIKFEEAVSFIFDRREEELEEIFKAYGVSNWKKRKRNGFVDIDGAFVKVDYESVTPDIINDLFQITMTLKKDQAIELKKTISKFNKEKEN
jgi:hypothetical protein